MDFKNIMEELKNILKNGADKIDFDIVEEKLKQLESLLSEMEEDILSKLTKKNNQEDE